MVDSLPCTGCGKSVSRKSPAGIIRFYCDNCQRTRNLEAKRFEAKLIEDGINRGLAYNRENNIRTKHDYGGHRQAPDARCDYCVGELGYSLRHMSDAYFYDPEVIPRGFRRD